MDRASIIVAVASPPGAAVRGVVRASGDGCLDLLAALNLPVIVRHAAIGRLDLGPAPLPVLVLAMAGPASYTGEDAAEIHTTGHPDVLDRVVQTLIAAGLSRGVPIRRAEAGEFTARAFLAGRLDLAEAEGVAAVIAAESDADLAAAHALRAGRLSDVVAEIAEMLATTLALVEAGIDFTDEDDVVAIESGVLRRRLTTIREQLESLDTVAAGSESAVTRPRVILTGPPNAGKSSLFNALLGADRAVVSPMAGTTRDVLIEPLTLHDDGTRFTVDLIDIAGWTDGGTTVDEAMQRIGRTARDHADIIVLCRPCNATLEATDARTMVVGTKGDLASSIGSTEGVIITSARTGSGLDALRSALIDRIRSLSSSSGANRFRLLRRHHEAIAAALPSLADAIALMSASADSDAPPSAELIAASLRSALDSVGQITGHIAPDDVLGRVFATFCIGK